MKKQLVNAILTTDMFAWAREDVTRMLVIPTNMEIRKSDGKAVMGAGTALIARDRFKTHAVDTEYANMLRAWATSLSGDTSKVPTDLGLTQLTGQIFVSAKAPVVYFPTKTFWQRPSSMELIQSNLDLLANMARAHPDTTFAVPLLGAGNGQLPKEEVLDAITEKLGGLDNIQVFDYQRKTPAGTAVGVGTPARTVPAAGQTTPPARVALADLDLEVPEPPQSIKELLAANKVLVVSGHRPDKLGGYSPQIRQHTRNVIGQILDSFKPTLVVAGGALGIDRAFMEMAEERGIQLLLTDPCQNFAARWNEKDQAKHEHLAAYARDTGAYIIVTDAPYKEAGGAQCLELRNRFMVELLEYAGEGSKFAIIHDGTAGGTANCKAAFVKRYGDQARSKYLGNFWGNFAHNHPLPGTLKAAQAATPAAAGATRLERPTVKVA